MLPRLLERITRAAFRRGTKPVVLGWTGDWPLLFLPASQQTEGPHLLVAAGFHGEEPAGCWGLLDFLESAPNELFKRSRLSFLPCVNPTGILAKRRCNDWGENPNRGFCHTFTEQPTPSVEGKVLLQHFDELKTAAGDGFLTLHEDADVSEFYLYTYEPGEEPGKFADALVAAERSFFAQAPDGELEGGFIKNGVIYRQCDGSFEDLLFHSGVPRAGCTETPGLLPFGLRAQANSKIIDAFVRYHLGA